MKVGTAAVGSAVFFVVAPLVVAGLVPWLIGVATATSVTTPVRATGVIVALAGLAGLLVCFADFVLARGTPAPVAPTERLVVEGPYRFVRNPMYVAVVTIVMGQALWWGSPWVAAYGVLVWATTATFGRIYEEPTLREQFGPEYDDYRAAVRAWIPRPRPWSRPADG